MEVLQHLLKSFTNLTNLLIDYSLLLASVGLTSMAILDALKGIFSIKEYFHRNMIKRWLALSTRGDNKEQVNNILHKVEDEMAATHQSTKEQSVFRYLNPFTLEPKRAVYALDTPKLMSKLQQAVEIKVLRCSASDDVNFIQVENGDGLDSEPKIQAQIERKDKIRELNNSLDTLQIQIIYTWGKLNRFTAICIGAALMYHILSPQLTGLPLIVFSLFGGALAPVAKQLLVSLRQVKRL